MVIPLGRSYVVAASLVLGSAWFVNRSQHAAPGAPEVGSKPTAPITHATSSPPPAPSLPDEQPVDDEPDEPDEPELRGLSIEDPSQFAMVFDAAGTTYLQLSTTERATSHGAQRLIAKDGEAVVVATVGEPALPDAFRAWSGKRVLVDGTCEAHVVGFAEVSRATGEPPSNEYEDEAGEWHHEAQPWTTDVVTNANTTLAAVLDGCHGTWARATDLPPAIIARLVDEPQLAASAREDLLARNDDDTTQKAWKEQGGEGDWQDAVRVETTTYRHPVSGEKWVFVQATHGGGCGDPSINRMAVYRTGVDGIVHRVAELEHASQAIHDVIDVDGDGQPELVMGTDNNFELLDLTDTSQSSIYVPELYEGCGC